jgi:hypothetical protein
MSGLGIMLASGVLLLLLAGLGFILSGRRNYSGDLWPLSTALLGLCAVCVLIVVACIGCTKHFDRAACYSWGHQTGRTVQWRAYAYGGLQWDCFVKTSDGHWLPKSQLRDIAP